MSRISDKPGCHVHKRLVSYWKQEEQKLNTLERMKRRLKILLDVIPKQNKCRKILIVGIVTISATVSMLIDFFEKIVNPLTIPTKIMG